MDSIISQNSKFRGPVDHIKKSEAGTLHAINAARSLPSRPTSISAPGFAITLGSLQFYSILTDQRFKNLHHFLRSMGLHSNWGYWSFSADQNNCDSSGAYVTCIYCGLSMAINMHEMLHGTQILFVFAHVWSAKI